MYRVLSGPGHQTVAQKDLRGKVEAQSLTRGFWLRSDISVLGRITVIAGHLCLSLNHSSVRVSKQPLQAD